MLALPASARAEPILYRLFLRSGGTVVSYGEFARVGDRVVVSMPLAPTTDSPRLHLLTLPESAIDWIETDRYSAAARHAHYVQTRAEADYAVMNADVAQQLNDVALAPDGASRLAIAERARRTLSEWPATHHNYRDGDVRQLVAMLDEIITELRAATGARQFDLTLVAAAEPPPPAILLPAPTLPETIAHALAAARLADISTERLSLLRSVLAMLESPPAGAPLDAAWLRETRKTVSSTLQGELATEREYTKLTRELLEAATVRASRADVRGVARLVRAAIERDGKLGTRRPEQMAALMAALELRLADARHLRLERDQWRSRVSTFRAYWRDVRPAMEDLGRARAALDDIRALAGPDLPVLGRLDALASRGAGRLARCRPPAELAHVHGILASAANLAASAAKLRRDAVTTGTLRAAWDASSAAAGAMMLLARARAELDRALSPPRLAPESSSR